ncbi:MAG: sulfite exporter TauE/SafE family protein, partial [Alphaproteobacteria bacterium]|nr:sulfite exporter TauE/SafE family protein [Alphaproteobacteria bacterium]
MHDHHHGWDAAWLLGGLPPELALYVAVFLTGLIGGTTHCLGMCGPFVLTRALRLAAVHEIGPAFSRMRAALLPGYHLGRAVTYGGFGAVAGGLAEGFAQVVELGWFRALFVAIAALLLVMGALGGTSLHLPGTQFLATKIVRVAPVPGFPGDFVTGIALGFLPCGLVLTAL